MNKMLVAVFDTDTAANAGLQALRALHAEGDITLYAAAMLSRDVGGHVSVRHPMDNGPVAACSGLAVGSLIGLLGGPAGVAVGAAAGTVAGALRDFWVAGVGLDFIEEAARYIQPGTTALVAEIEEEWIVPADSALEAAGGRVFRRSRTEVAEAQMDHDIVAFKAEIRELESEASHAAAAAKGRLQMRIAATRSALEAALQAAVRRVDALEREAAAKAEQLHMQLSDAKATAKARIEDRLKKVRGGYRSRGAKLAQAWGLTRQALAA